MSQKCIIFWVTEFSSCPEIAIYKKYPNGKHTRTTLHQANTKRLFLFYYSMSFKLQIVQKIERGDLTVTEATNRYRFNAEKLL